MKPIHILPPVIALVLVGSWIGVQRRTLATLVDENERLARHAVPATMPESVEALFPKMKKARVITTAEDSETLDYLYLAELIDDRNHDRRGPLVLAELDKQLRAMDKDELVTHIKEIMELDLSKRQRWGLIDKFLSPLIDKDPELALRSFFGQFGGMDRVLSRACGEWSASDLSAATEWFDEQIAAGTMEPKRLNGRDGCRAGFEGQLLKLLLASDPAAAIGRMENINLDLRKSVA